MVMSEVGLFILGYLALCSIIEGIRLLFTNRASPVMYVKEEAEDADPEFFRAMMLEQGEYN